MAGETLRGVTELIAAYTDNLTGDISALDGRDFIISSAIGVAFMEDIVTFAQPFTIPLVADVPTDILAAVGAANVDFVGNFWKQDVNNGLVPSYTDIGVTVPPATFRLVDGGIVMLAQKTGGGTADFTFQGTEGGVLTGNPRTIPLSTTPQLLIFSGDRLYDVNLAAPLSVDVTAEGHADDLQLFSLTINLTSTMI